MTSYWKLRTRPEMARGQSLAADAITRPLSIEEAERARAEQMTDISPRATHADEAQQALSQTEGER